MQSSRPGRLDRSSLGRFPKKFIRSRWGEITASINRANFIYFHLYFVIWAKTYLAIDENLNLDVLTLIFTNTGWDTTWLCSKGGANFSGPPCSALVYNSNTNRSIFRSRTSYVEVQFHNILKTCLDVNLTFRIHKGGLAMLRFCHREDKLRDETSNDVLWRMLFLYYY